MFCLTLAYFGKTYHSTKNAIVLEFLDCLWCILSLEQTGLIPHISQDDVISGLSTKLLRQVIDKQDVNESLLKYVIFKLPLVTVKKPYDASGVDLVRILSKSTDCRLIERLLDLGMKLKPSQMEAIVLFIPVINLDTFDVLLQYARKNNFTQSSLNAACMKAMELDKVDFIIHLIDAGAAPPADELIRVVGLSEHPTIQQYLAFQTSTEEVENPYRDMFDTEEDTSSYEKVLSLSLSLSLMYMFMYLTHTYVHTLSLWQVYTTHICIVIICRKGVFIPTQ